MKTWKILNKSSQILAAACTLASLVFYFFPFAALTAGGKEITLTAAQMTFKGTIEQAGNAKMAVSADVWFCFWLVVLGVVFTVFTFIRGKFSRWAAPAFMLGSGIYMLVIGCSSPAKFVDVRPLDTVLGADAWSTVHYEYAVWVIMAAMFGAFVFGTAHLLINDHITVAAAKSGKGSIPKRFVRFIKDYKSELKKVVWPSWQSVVKNTVIVLIMCLIVGVVIWVLDFGLSKLLDVLFK